jgi:hypothetical protein
MLDAGAMASKLGLDLSGYTSGMLQATSIASVFPQTVTSFLANPLLGLIDVAKNVTSAITSAVQTWLSAVTEFGNRADDVGDKAAALGVSTDFLSGWGAAFQDAGSSAEGLGEALKFVSDNAQEAVRGNKTAAEAFHQIGINVDFLRGNLGDTEALMRKTVDAIAGLPTVAERIGAAKNLLGRGGADAVGAISGGTADLDKFADTIRRLGGTITAEDAKWADSFGKLSSYAAAMEGLQRAAARPVLKALAEHFGSVEEGMVQVSEILQVKIGQLSDWIVKMSLEAVEWWKKHGDEVLRFGESINRTSHFMSGLAAGFEQLRLAAEPTIRLLEKLNELAEPLGGLGAFVSPVYGGLNRLGYMRDMAARAGGGGGGGDFGGGGGDFGATVVMGPVIMQAPNPGAASDELARKLNPHLQEAMRRQTSAFNSGILSEYVKDHL